MTKSTPACEACQEVPPLFPFTMAFQPIVDIEKNRIVSQEALARGPNGESAASVLSQVNETNRYAFDQACRVKAIEMAVKLKWDRRLNINFLPNAVYDPKACIRQTLAAAARTGFPQDHLTFEFLEHESIADPEHVWRIVGDYRSQGFKVAMDDFGKGYSDLYRLAYLLPDIIKLDRDLIVDCDQNKIRASIAASLVRMCAEIGVIVVAEGVERIGEIDTLRAMGVRFFQGFYFARPTFEKMVHDADVAWPPA